MNRKNKNTILSDPFALDDYPACDLSKTTKLFGLKYFERIGQINVGTEISYDVDDCGRIHFEPLKCSYSNEFMIYLIPDVKTVCQIAQRMLMDSPLMDKHNLEIFSIDVPGV